MTRNTKALLLSVLVFPGFGQFILKRYKSSALFICTSLVAIIYIALDVFEKAHAIVERIITGEIQPEYSVIRKLITDQQTDSYLITIITYSLIAIWLLNIIDVLRLRKGLASN